MSNRLYMEIDNNTVKKLNIKSKREYYYKIEEEKKIIREQQFENTNNINQVQLVDDEDEWNYKTESLFLNVNFEMDNYQKLFGYVCCEDAILGVGIEWKPENSRIKNCIKLGEFSYKSSDCFFHKENIEIENVNSNIDFSWIIYIVDPGTINKKAYYGSHSGLILGSGLLWSIIVDGNGSIFPIYEEAKVGKPLWWYHCDFSDISEDEFSEENIKIIINKAHPGYQYIQPKSNIYNEYMFSELISTALAVLILSIRQKNSENGNGEFIDLSQQSCKGSILTVLKYFNDMLKFKINGTMLELQNSVKTYFDKEY